MSFYTFLFLFTTTVASNASCTAAITALSFAHHMILRTVTTSHLFEKKPKQVDYHHEICDEEGTHQRQKQHNIQFIAKTVESFKLADLYWLEACVMAHCQSESTQSASSQLLASGNSWNVRKLAFHRPTASYLLGCYTTGDNMDRQNENNPLAQPPPMMVNVPFRKERCQYVAQVIATGQSPQEFLEDISKGVRSGTHKWTLDYDILEPLQGCVHPRRSFSSTMLMCAVARILPGAPLLTSVTQNQSDVVSYMILETSSRLYLAQKISCDAGVPAVSVSDLQNPIRSSWARRPFQYSGAINFDVAIAVVDILSDILRKNKNPESLRMLDPTCGSGTFLALALMKWGSDSNVEVTGIDSNPKCSLGSAQNVQHIFHTSIDENRVIGSSDVSSWSLTLDSKSTRKLSRATFYSGNSAHLQSFIPHKFDCAVANLPWNRNTFEFQGGTGDNKCINSKILEATAAALLPGSPFVVVSGGSQRSNQSSHLTRNKLDTPFNARQCLDSIGFQVLGEVTVPPRGFHLPLSEKKADLSAPQEHILRSSDCLITVAVAPCIP